MESLLYHVIHNGSDLSDSPDGGNDFDDSDDLNYDYSDDMGYADDSYFD